MNAIHFLICVFAVVTTHCGSISIHMQWFRYSRLTNLENSTLHARWSDTRTARKRCMIIYSKHLPLVKIIFLMFVGWFLMFSQCAIDMPNWYISTLVEECLLWFTGELQLLKLHPNPCTCFNFELNCIHTKYSHLMQISKLVWIVVSESDRKKRHLQYDSC